MTKGLISMAYELIRLVHFAAIFVVSATVLIHYIAFAPEITREDARNLYKVDMAFWAASAVVLIAGLVLWLGVGKPASFYSPNSLFHTKLGLFFGMLLCSIPATKFFRLEGRRAEIDADADVKIVTPTLSRSLVRGKFLTLAVIFICAYLVARGVGL
jgi:putative membrane protein